jgi:hypothetical protein
MSKSITNNRGKSEKSERDSDFLNIMKPKKVKTKVIDEKRKIYHNGRQYIVKIPKEIILHLGFKEGDMLRYTLTKHPNKIKPELNIKYISKDGRTKK